MSSENPAVFTIACVPSISQRSMTFLEFAFNHYLKFINPVNLLVAYGWAFCCVCVAIGLG
jgi:hypothetical protein